MCRNVRWERQQQIHRSTQFQIIRIRRRNFCLLFVHTTFGTAAFPPKLRPTGRYFVVKVDSSSGYLYMGVGVPLSTDSAKVVAHSPSIPRRIFCVSRLSYSPREMNCKMKISSTVVSQIRYCSRRKPFGRIEALVKFRNIGGAPNSKQRI